MSIVDGLKRLENEKIWKIGERTANKRNIKKGDFFLLYSSGDGNRDFVASGMLGSEYINDGSPLYGHVIFEDVTIFSKKVHLKSVLKNLDFIKNKDRYGSYLQSGIIRIGEKDFNEIIRKVKALNRS
jgi:predicted RNA-binding protein